MARVYLGHWRWLQEQGESYKQQAASCKRQALTADPGYDRMNLESEKYI